MRDLRYADVTNTFLTDWDLKSEKNVSVAPEEL